MLRLAIAASLFALTAAAQVAPPRPQPPVRDPHSPGYVTATELPDGENPPANADGNFILGPTHTPAPETQVQAGVPQGTIVEFTMSSADSRFYPGIARDPGSFGTPDPANPAKMVVTTSHPAPYTRKVTVYVPKQYVPGTVAPFIVGADGPDHMLFTTLDNLISEHRLPVMIAISIGNGGGDAQGSERGLEYDTVSGKYAEFVEQEVLPRVEAEAHVKLTRDPDGRATMGGSSGGAAAMIMAWYHPELYHRVLSYSGTFINQQWPYNPETPHGAWGLHETLIPDSPPKPIRIWMEVGDRDLYNPNIMRDGMHDWVLANEKMAAALAAKGYHYQFVFARNAGHVDHSVKAQTLAEALEYVWQGYPIATNATAELESRIQQMQSKLADWAQLNRYRADNAALLPPAPGEQRVVFYGDSITDAWPIAKFFPGRPYINRGISGQTTPQMLVRFQQDVVHLKPAAVIILAGTNDIAGNTGPETPEMIEDNLTSMAAIAKYYGIKVIFASILPAIAYPWKPGVHPADEIRALNAWLKDFCHRDGDIYLDYYSSLADAEGGMKPGLSKDGVHPTPVGYAIMSPLAEGAIITALVPQPSGK